MSSWHGCIGDGIAGRAAARVHARQAGTLGAARWARCVLAKAGARTASQQPTGGGLRAARTHTAPRDAAEAHAHQPSPQALKTRGAAQLTCHVLRQPALKGEGARVGQRRRRLHHPVPPQHLQGHPSSAGRSTEALLLAGPEAGGGAVTEAEAAAVEAGDGRCGSAHTPPAQDPRQSSGHAPAGRACGVAACPAGAAPPAPGPAVSRPVGEAHRGAEGPWQHRNFRAGCGGACKAGSAAHPARRAVVCRGCRI